MYDSTGKLPLKAVCTVAAMLLTACATTPAAPSPKLERLSSGDAAAPPTLVLEDIAGMPGDGASEDDILARLKSRPSDIRLSASAILQLAQRGVSPKVIDYLLERERRKLFDDAATELSRRDSLCQERIEQEIGRCRALAAPHWHPGDPACWPPRAGAPYWRCF